MKAKEKVQVRITMSLGKPDIGAKRLARWKKAAARELPDPKLFHAWLRLVIDQECDEVLEGK